MSEKPQKTNTSIRFRLNEKILCHEIEFEFFEHRTKFSLKSMSGLSSETLELSSKHATMFEHAVMSQGD